MWRFYITKKKKIKQKIKKSTSSQREKEKITGKNPLTFGRNEFS